MNPSAFKTLPISPSILEAIEALGFKDLTPIQAESLPPLLQGHDLIGQAQTGSGKTAAFSIPMLQAIALQQRGPPQALVLCPTRELCTQVLEQVRSLGKRLPGLRVVQLAGGSPIHPQLGALEQGVHIAIGTPGRVMDHLRRRSLVLDRLKVVVLDEADRMLEMGFREDMEVILKDAPRARQTILFSATFPPTITQMSASFQRDPVRVTIEAVTPVTTSIHQEFLQVERQDKLSALLPVLAEKNPESGIIFCNLKSDASLVADHLKKLGVSAAALHGDLEQWERDHVMARFRGESLRLIVATDVAARGIDVPDLDLVINFDLPHSPEIYVHRIGRTGRAGKTGQSVTFFSPREQNKIDAIVGFVAQTVSSKKFEASQDPYPNAQALMRTLRLSEGRKNKVRAGDILGALTGETGGLTAQDVGKIEIHDHHSFVSINRHVASQTLHRLREGRIKGRKLRVDLI